MITYVYLIIYVSYSLYHNISMIVTCRTHRSFRVALSRIAVQVYDINPELVDDQGFVDILKELLGDGSLGQRLPMISPYDLLHLGR